MKTVALLLSVLALSSTMTDAKLSWGGCPTMTSIDYNAGMSNPGKLYFHYIDKLVNNVYTLANTIGLKKYRQFDCQYFDFSGLITIDATMYKSLANAPKFNGFNIPVKFAVTYFDATTKTWVGTACVDAESIATALAMLAAFGVTLPSGSEIVIQILTYVLKVISYQVTIVASQATNISSVSTGVQNAIVNGPGKYKMGYLKSITQSTCSKWTSISDM